MGPSLFSFIILIVFIFGTACQIYCYGRYCVRRSVSPQVPENPSGPLVDNFIVLPCVAFGVACVKLLPGVDRWNSLDDPRVIGPCHCEVWGWPRHCPASRTTLVATRFRVAVICPIIQVPHCIRVFFYFVWFVFINHIFQFYYELCTYCNILDIYLS